MIDLIPKLEFIEKRIIRTALPVLILFITAGIFYSDYVEHQKLKEDTRESMSILLEKPLVKGNLIELYNITSSFEKTIDGLTVCILDSQRNFLYGRDCKNPEKLAFNFYDSEYYMEIDIKIWDKLLIKSLFILFISGSIFLIGKALRTFITIIKNDMSIVSSDSTEQILSTEFNDLNRNLQEREKYKQRLIDAKSKIQHANELRVIAHDLRSPITVIDFIIRDLNILPTKKKLLQQALSQINGICEDVLLKSKNHQGPSNIQSFFQVFCQNKRCEFSKEQAEINLKIKSVDNKECFFDEVKLQSIMSNLLNNSLEAKRDGTVLKVEVQVYQEGEFLIIDIEDNGEGIPMEAQSKLFKKNFTTKSTGNGLGLHEAKKYLNEIGGEIKYVATNKGAKFRLSLPNTQAQKSPLLENFDREDVILC